MIKLRSLGSPGAPVALVLALSGLVGRSSDDSENAMPTPASVVSGMHVEAGFVKLDALYAREDGEAIPTPPATWSSENPSAQDLDSDFGKLYAGIQAAVSMDSPDSVVVNMNHGASAMGFDQFSE